MTTSPNSELVAKLLTAANQNERINDLKDTDFVFDFVNSTHTAQGADGFITVVNPSSFPALLAGNGAIGVGVIGPCGLNTPHVHPRGSEIQINVGGGVLMAQFVQENNARVVKNLLPPGSATVFPKGAIHFQQNLGCDPVTFIASFDFVDAGVSQVALNLFKLDKDILSATFNDIGVEFLDKLVVPPNIALGAQSCFDRCKINRKKFVFNGTFADFFESTKHHKALASASPYQAMLGSGSDPNTMSGMFRKSFIRSQETSFSENPLRSTVIGLSATLVAVILLALFVVIKGKRSQRKAKKAEYMEAVSANMVDAPYRDAVVFVEKA
ncbi:RmlC-like cupin domain-containing protein [Hysterangium stoloniferum]|nr:RmlC-like cupin domain-containing protein [Hysterangium stoloniferum]